MRRVRRDRERPILAAQRRAVTRVQRLPGWTEIGLVRAEAEVRRVVLGEGVFLVLAEHEREDFLLYRLEPAPRGDHVLRGHDGVPEAFAGALEDLLPRRPGRRRVLW